MGVKFDEGDMDDGLEAEVVARPKKSYDKAPVMTPSPEMEGRKRPSSKDRRDKEPKDQAGHHREKGHRVSLGIDYGREMAGRLEYRSKLI